VAQTVQDWENPDTSGLTRGLDIATDLVGAIAVGSSFAALRAGAVAANATSETDSAQKLALARVGSGYASSSSEYDLVMAASGAEAQEAAAQDTLAEWLSWSKAGGWTTKVLAVAGVASSWVTGR
jgi:hypothetical protein